MVAIWQLFRSLSLAGFVFIISENPYTYSYKENMLLINQPLKMGLN